jgi:hypothetical protein
MLCQSLFADFVGYSRTIGLTALKMFVFPKNRGKRRIESDQHFF